jgi:hypothetical protein
MTTYELRKGVSSFDVLHDPVTMGRELETLSVMSLLSTDRKLMGL